MPVPQTMSHIEMTAPGGPEVRPVIEFSPAEEIARLWKGGDPAAIDQARIPAHVIKVQMCAEDGVDASCRKARSRQIREECSLQIAEHIVLTLAIGADAGVDHYALPARSQHEGLE